MKPAYTCVSLDSIICEHVTRTWHINFVFPCIELTANWQTLCQCQVGITWCVIVCTARASGHWGEVLEPSGRSCRQNQEVEESLDDVHASQVWGIALFVCEVVYRHNTSVSCCCNWCDSEPYFLQHSWGSVHQIGCVGWLLTQFFCTRFL